MAVNGLPDNTSRFDSMYGVQSLNNNQRTLPVFSNVGSTPTLNVSSGNSFLNRFYNPNASSNIANVNAAYEGLDVNSPDYSRNLASFNEQAVQAANAGAFDSGLLGTDNSDASINPLGGGQGLANFGTGVNIATGLYGAYLGNKQLGLQEDAFNFNKAMKEKEYAMAKDAYDRQVARADSIGSQMRAGKVE